MKYLLLAIILIYISVRLVGCGIVKFQESLSHGSAITQKIELQIKQID